MVGRGGAWACGILVSPRLSAVEISIAGEGEYRRCVDHLTLQGKLPQPNDLEETLGSLLSSFGEG